MFYWGDYLAIGILLFTLGFMIGWTACSMKDYETEIEAKRHAEMLKIQLRYKQMEEKYRREHAKKEENK